MKEMFYQILETFENKDIRDFAETIINNAPKYFFEVPASSTGKYHPSYSLGEGGLVRHTIALCKLLNHMLSVESISNQFTSRERDLLRVSGIAHDMMKSGTQADYEKSKWTKFEHPLMAAEMVERTEGLSEEEKFFCGQVIASHMGIWNTDKRYPDVILPKPNDKYQIILHLADYLASRKDIEIKFDTEETHAEPPTVDNYKFDFGKHSGKTFQEVYDEDRGWLRWARDNVTREPFATLIKEFKPKTN